MKILKIIYKSVAIKIPGYYRLDGWTTGITNRKLCCLLFPIGFPVYKAQKIIRRKLGMVPEDITE